MAVVNEVSTFANIPQFVPFGELYYTQDTGNLYIGTGFSTGSDFAPLNPGPNVNVELVSGPGGLPGGFNGDIQYNNNGALGGSAATITAAGTINIPTGQNFEINGVPIGGSSSGAWATLTGDLTSTQAIPFDGPSVGTPDTGLSRLGPGIVGFGTGAAASTAGGLVATTATITNGIATTATVANLTATTATITNEIATTATVANLTATTATITNEIATTATVTTDHVTNSNIVTATITTGTVTTLYSTTATVSQGSLTISDVAAHTELILANTTAATSTSTNGSPLAEFKANYWTGTASAADTWTIGSSLAAGTNGASTLTFSHSGSTGAAVALFPSSGGLGKVIGFTGGSAGIATGIAGANTLAILIGGAISANFTGSGIQCISAGII